MFRDRYLLTIDSKATDNQTAENSRLLLFDPASGQLVFEQRIAINQESEDALKQRAHHRIKGHILPETNTKPRFLAVHNDQIYIADLGRRLRPIRRLCTTDLSRRSQSDLRHEHS